MSEEWALKRAVQKVLPRWARVQKLAKIVIVAMAIFFALFLVAIYTIPLPERLDAPMSTAIHYDDGRPAHVFLAADGRWRMEADHTSVDADYVKALLALEDKRFWDHGGVDVVAIARATMTNASRGRVVSGASTITMQVVRMAEHRPRTIRSKLIEGFRAVQVERRYSKEEILDIYLNLLPFGQNYEGVETASHVYFGHDASCLTPSEIATLLAVPQAPNSRYPTEANEERLRAARDSIARRLLESGDLPRGLYSDRLTLAQAMESIENTPVPTELQRMPREIPHLATTSLISGLPSDARQIPREATVDGSGALNWFTNGRFMGQVRGGERLWWEPQTGEHDIMVTDENGRSQRRAVEVR